MFIHTSQTAAIVPYRQISLRTMRGFPHAHIQTHTLHLQSHMYKRGKCCGNGKRRRQFERPYNVCMHNLMPVAQILSCHHYANMHERQLSCNSLILWLELCSLCAQQCACKLLMTCINHTLQPRRKVFSIHICDDEWCSCLSRSCQHLFVWFWVWGVIKMSFTIINWGF